MILFLDHYDSFAYNVVHLLASQGAQIEIMHTDDPRVQPAMLESYRGIVIGPGPGAPSQAPQMMAVVRAALQARVPTLGVCYGLQALGEASGARVVHAPAQMHGKTSMIAHEQHGLFLGVPTPFRATRYHSLCLDEASLPPSIRVTARSEDGVIQGIERIDAPAVAVQFHPESVLSEHGETLARNFLDMLD